MAQKRCRPSPITPTRSSRELTGTEALSACLLPKIAFAATQKRLLLVPPRTTLCRRCCMPTWRTSLARGTRSASCEAARPQPSQSSDNPLRHARHTCDHETSDSASQYRATKRATSRFMVGSRRDASREEAASGSAQGGGGGAAQGGVQVSPPAHSNLSFSTKQRGAL